MIDRWDSVIPNWEAFLNWRCVSVTLLCERRVQQVRNTPSLCRVCTLCTPGIKKVCLNIFHERLMRHETSDSWMGFVFLDLTIWHIWHIWQEAKAAASECAALQLQADWAWDGLRHKNDRTWSIGPTWTEYKTVIYFQMNTWSIFSDMLLYLYLFTGTPWYASCPMRRWTTGDINARLWDVTSSHRVTFTASSPDTASEEASERPVTAPAAVTPSHVPCQSSYEWRRTSRGQWLTPQS